jgi:NADH-quinone oxidoreductase subunit J
MFYVFVVFSLLTLIPALFVVLTKNIAKAAFALLFTFFGMAGLYVILAADFIAATQVLVYVGGILVLLLFGVMLTKTPQGGPTMSIQPMKALPAFILSGGIFLTLLTVISRTVWRLHLHRHSLPSTTVDGIGRLFLGKYLLPFEVASVLLLVVLVGAMFLARKEEN